MKDKLAVGIVTNMYDIVESMNHAGKDYGNLVRNIGTVTVI